MIMEDGSAVPPEDCRIGFEIAMAAETPYALGRGDIIVLDNLLMAHGRSRFTGPRKIFTALGDRVASRQTALTLVAGPTRFDSLRCGASIHFSVGTNRLSSSAQFRTTLIWVGTDSSPLFTIRNR